MNEILVPLHAPSQPLTNSLTNPLSNPLALSPTLLPSHQPSHQQPPFQLLGALQLQVIDLSKRLGGGSCNTCCSAGTGKLQRAMQPLSAERATPGNVDYNTVQAHRLFSAYNGTDGEKQNDWAQLVSTAAHTVSCVDSSYHALDVRTCNRHPVEINSCWHGKESLD